MKKLILTAAFLVVPTLGLADAGDTRIMEVWSCTLKDGKTPDEVMAHNAKWLAFVRQASSDVQSYGLVPIVGDAGTMTFADSFPDLNAWSAVKKAMDSDEGRALMEGFDTMLECSGNRLYESTEH